MILELPEIGLYSLILALALNVVLSIVPFTGYFTGNNVLMAAAKPLAKGQFLFIFLAFIILSYSFYIDDFSVQYVANHSNSLLPWYYKLSAVWGGHEGSMLLWVLMLGGWSIAVAVFSKSLPNELTSLVLSILGWVTVGFLLFLIVTLNPFDCALPFVSVDGADLNPLLQDFGLIIHPPMLYMDYVGFSVAFAFALAALISGQMDAAWIRWARPWTIMAWSFLTLGIGLGSWWAYYELGWGGWWFWDPVENASFLPWLIGTALIHSFAVAEKRGTFKAWTLILAIFAFSFSLLGTFLVRSGVLTSVHAFANDPERGFFILALLFITVFGSLILFFFKAHRFASQTHFDSLSREFFLLLNNVVLFVTAFVILILTLAPLISKALNMGDMSIGAPIFNPIFGLLMTVLFTLLGVGQVLRWKQNQFAPLWQPLLLALVFTIGAAVAFVYSFGDLNGWALLGSVLGFWIISTLFMSILQQGKHKTGLAKFTQGSRSYWAMVLAHLALAFITFGAVIVSNFEVKKDVLLKAGESAELAGYVFRFDGVEDKRILNFDSKYGTVSVFKDEQFVVTLHPEKRNYIATGKTMTEAGISSSIYRDLFVSLAEELDDDAWAIRIQVKPWVQWLWLGVLVMSFAGVLSVSDKRYRKKKNTVKNKGELQ